MGTTGVGTILYPVRDLAKAEELFTRRKPRTARLQPPQVCS
jgi:hypothetical protein